MGNPSKYPDTRIQPRVTSEQIQADVDAFLAKGNKIYYAGVEETAYPALVEDKTPLFNQPCKPKRQ